MANNYLNELRSVTEQREQFNARTRQLHEARGVPPEVPLVAHENDDELMEYLREGELLVERERAFYEKYHGPGIDDPHLVED